MKTRMTVAWCYTLDVEVDPSKMKDDAYVDKIKSDAITQAGKDMDLTDGLVTDCEDFPDIAD